MPDKPRWLDRIPQAIASLENASLPWVDRSMVEELLGIRRRRAQQVLSPLAIQRSGRTVIVDRTALITHLRRLAAGEASIYEQQRRERLWQRVKEERKRWTETPPVFVEAPSEMLQAVYRKDFEGLPEGVTLVPGGITVTFKTPDEGLQKLLALALAVGQNRLAFEDLVRVQNPND